MKLEQLEIANSVQNKLKDVHTLLHGINESNVLTIGVGLYPAIKYNAEIRDPHDEVQCIEARCYERITEILRAYEHELKKVFEKI